MAGVLLLGWLVVELVIIREVSLFQPLYAAIAVAFICVGRAALPSVQRR